MALLLRAQKKVVATAKLKGPPEEVSQPIVCTSVTLWLEGPHAVGRCVQVGHFVSNGCRPAHERSTRVSSKFSAYFSKHSDERAASLPIVESSQS